AHSQSGYFIANNNTPDLIISSPANRALHTAVIFARNMMMDFNRLKIDPGIYMGDTSEILSIIKSTIDDVNSLMIFGHNPSFTELANHFLNYPVENIPTAGMVFLTFTNVSWAEISPKYVETEDMKFPKK
ncbi:MAG: SixA phosphatase family protein, partial [Bacteroidota bacterium]